jgi:hypothetical protein
MAINDSDLLHDCEIAFTPDEVGKNIQYCLDHNLTFMSPDQIARLPMDRIYELCIEAVIHKLIHIYHLPIMRNKNGGLWLWEGTINDFGDELLNHTSILNAVRLAKRLNWPIMVGGSQLGPGRPRSNTDDFIEKVRGALKAKPNITQAKLAEYLECDEKTIKRKTRKAGFRSFQDMRRTILMN